MEGADERRLPKFWYADPQKMVNGGLDNCGSGVLATPVRNWAEPLGGGIETLTGFATAERDGAQP